MCKSRAKCFNRLFPGCERKNGPVQGHLNLFFRCRLLYTPKGMPDRSIIFDANAMRALRSGQKTQSRHIATSPLAACKPGDRLWVKETWVGGRIPPGETRDHFAPMRSAEFVVFPDGWQQYRDGKGHAGPKPTSPRLQWNPAIHLPQWASRMTLIVEAVLIERLQQSDRTDILADGQFASFAGFFWRWRKPGPGIWRDPRRAYAALWNATHGTPGERWEDNPEVVILRFRVAFRTGAQALPLRS